MATTTIDLDTELSAVNSILGSIGQAPVTTLGRLTTTVSSTDEVANTYENPEIALIYNILKSCCQDVQNEGWHFNKEYHVEVEPDANKNILEMLDDLLFNKFDWGSPDSGIHSAFYNYFFFAPPARPF